jgi:glycosyltransferase involved in cell wall biosynthesis
MGKVGISPERKLLFSAARLVPAKGLDQLIGQFLENGFGDKGWTYVIAGVGPLEAELKDQVARYEAGAGGKAAVNSGSSVVFVGFQQPSENLALMAHAEILGLPSRYEPHGIVVAEAMAAGTPVLASDVVGAAKDLVTSGLSGLIFR